MNDIKNKSEETVFKGKGPFWRWGKISCCLMPTLLHSLVPGEEMSCKLLNIILEVGICAVNLSGRAAVMLSGVATPPQLV